MKIDLNQNDYLSRMGKCLLYWSCFSIISSFHGTFFLIVSILFSGIIILATIREFYLKKIDDGENQF